MPIHKTIAVLLTALNSKDQAGIATAFITLRHRVDKSLVLVTLPAPLLFKIGTQYSPHFRLAAEIGR